MITLLKKQYMLYLLIIFVLAAFLRFYGLNWDQGYHLHPDERAIVMFTTPLNFPSSIEEFLSASSPWNPHFFAYGSFPIYLLKTVASVLANFDPLYLFYEKINLVGRAISAIADIGTLILLYLLAKKLFNKTVGVFASFFYAISVFPIQASHFYAVDTLLTFFITLTLYQLIRFYEKPTVLNSIQVGIFLGLSLSTKVSAIPLVIAVFAAIGADFTLLVIKQPHKPHIWFPHVPRFLKRLMFDGFMIAVSTIIIFSILQPYAIIDFQEFLRQTRETSQVTNNAFAFPFTLQYVGKIPYLYEIRNVFLFGLGPVIAGASFAGIFFFVFNLFQKARRGTIAKEIIIFTFFLTYFFVVGKFSVGFMRYLLPIYPLLALFAAVFVLKALVPNINRLLSKQFSIFNFQFSIGLLVVLVFIGSILLWPLSFMHIYTQPNTRVLASNWINQNIPPGKTLAIEHWDDSLPLVGQQNYQMLTLSLYDPDTTYKWKIINEQLQQTDYIIIASNRLYVPLMKLTNCAKLPPGRCYSDTAQYYNKLFDGSLGFSKVAEFAVHPNFSFFIFHFLFDDSSADESFTVYDHPKVIIFKKIP